MYAALFLSSWVSSCIKCPLHTIFCIILYIVDLPSIQELVEERDNLEKQLSQLTGLLGQVEEKRLSAIKDMENMKVTYTHAYYYTYLCMYTNYVSIDFGAMIP